MDEKIEVSIFRYDPAKDFKPRYERYEVPYRDGITVLEVLRYIYDNYSPIAFRYGCRIKACGTCSLMMNQRPVLACKERAQKVMTIEPLPILPVIKDLAFNYDRYLEKRARIRPFIDPPKPSVEMPRALSFETVNRYRECEICIECLLCDAACPLLRDSRKGFSGPSIMLEIARLYREPQDDGDRIRIATSEGLLQCDLCGRCSEVCPVDIKVHEIIKDLQEIARKEK